MRAAGPDGEFYLGKLAELGAELARTTPGSEAFFAGPLHIVQAAMGFTVSVIYRVEHVVDRTLILEIVGVLDPANRRAGFERGRQLAIDLDSPDRIYCNEARAFAGRGVAAVNVPGVGCDIAGYVSAGESAADAFILGGDFVGDESSVQAVDVRVFEIATGLLSALLTKAHFQQRADRDRLTGLMSSARIRVELDEVLQRRATSPGRAVVVALADVDDFKGINDQHGHLLGDAVLKDLGRLVSEVLHRERDCAGRYGGDEFLLLLDDTGGDAPQRLERLRLDVERRACGGVPATLSIGACVLEPESGPSATEALATADRALYAAKQAGRNRVVVLPVNRQ